MKRRFLVLSLAALLAAPVGLLAQTRRALVIGVGQQLDPSWPKVHADRDVPLIVGMLRANGYADITTLVNRQATKAAIVAAFRSLARRARRGDVVLVHFSGHGQRMTDTDGDEPDGWDESWIPYDAFLSYGPHDRGEKHLCDDETARLLTALRQRIGPKGVLAVTVDACHSGDSTRGDDSVSVRGVLREFVIPGKHGRGARQLPEQWQTLSACKSYQLNQETPQGYGRLSAALSSMWKSMVGQSDQRVLEVISGFMQRRDIRGPLPQTPELTGSNGKHPFSSIFRR